MLKTITARVFKMQRHSNLRDEETLVGADREALSDEMLKLLAEYDAIKEDHYVLRGGDFDRAFAFIEKYPHSLQAQQLKEEMTATVGPNLKGLSYRSAVDILTKMPDHPGKEAIVRGMYLIEEDYIFHLEVTILTFILEIAPDHPHVETIVNAVVAKNLTVAYSFVTENSEHPHCKAVIEAMFRENPNIALLLLQDEMGRRYVDAILQGIYMIPIEKISRLTPNAILFVLDIAPDHPCVEALVRRLVAENYIKAFLFVKESTGSPVSALVKDVVAEHHPELARLF